MRFTIFNYRSNSYIVDPTYYHGLLHNIGVCKICQNSNIVVNTPSKLFRRVRLEYRKFPLNRMHFKQQLLIEKLFPSESRPRSDPYISL